MKIETKNKNLVYEDGKFVLYCGRLGDNGRPEKTCRQKPLLMLDFPRGRDAKVEIAATCPMCGDLNRVTVNNKPRGDDREVLQKPRLLWDDPDISSWIRVKKVWTSFRELAEEKRPDKRVEARHESYGCDTGCTGYRVYVVKGDKEEPFGFFFQTSEAVKIAEKVAASRRIDCIIVEQNL